MINDIAESSASKKLNINKDNISLKILNFSLFFKIKEIIYIIYKNNLPSNNVKAIKILIILK